MPTPRPTVIHISTLLFELIINNCFFTSAVAQSRYSPNFHLSLWIFGNRSIILSNDCSFLDDFLGRFFAVASSESIELSEVIVHAASIEKIEKSKGEEKNKTKISLEVV